MGCTGSTNALPPENSKEPLRMVNPNPSNENQPNTKKSIAFVVPLHEEEDSLIRKHPPKRFQRLEEQQTTPPLLTHEMLQEKLAEAQQRRLQILRDRIESAKILMKPKSINGNGKSFHEMVETPRLIDVEG